MTPVANDLLDRLADAGGQADLAAVLVAWWGQDGPPEKATEALGAVDAAIRQLQAVRDVLVTAVAS